MYCTHLCTVHVRTHLLYTLIHCTFAYSCTVHTFTLYQHKLVYSTHLYTAPVHTYVLHVRTYTLYQYILINRKMYTLIQCTRTYSCSEYTTQ